MPSTSLWDSRFSDDGGQAVALYQSRRDGETIDIGDILGATKSELPYIGPEELEFHGVLGAGSSFKVHREIYNDRKSKAPDSRYFVAVKHMILTAPDQTDKRRRLYAGVLREIRALMHPPLRDHSCIIPVLAYGWTNHPNEGASPYLVVDYSDHGTLSQYLLRCNISMRERRELALDVAHGIKVLHNSNIIHGDVKPNNVIVFDSFLSVSRPQSAKLADFGSSLFGLDVEKDHVSYLGTAKYNAPEVEGRGFSSLVAGTSRMLQYQKADIYSFGLLLWETLKDGRSFIDKNYLQEGENDLQFLQRLYAEEKDGLLRRVNSWCYGMRDRKVLDSYDARETNRLKHRIDSELFSPISETFGLALRDDASKRANIDEVIKTLGRGSTETRGRTQYPLARSAPPLTPVTTPAPHLQRAMPISTNKARYMPLKYTPHASVAGWKSSAQKKKFLPAPVVQETPPVAPQEFVYKVLNMFEASIAPSPPWHVQCSIVNKLKLDIRYEQDPIKHAESALQLSICYRVGFGINPDENEMLHHLSLAAVTNGVARSILPRVFQAYHKDSVDPFKTNSSPLKYFSERVQARRRSISVQIANSSLFMNGTPIPKQAILSSLKTWAQLKDMPVMMISQVKGHTVKNANLMVYAATIGSTNILTELLHEKDIDDRLISDSLLAACKYGHFEAALLLISRCKDYHGLSTEPNPLHWLVMFDEFEACHLARVLVKGQSGVLGRSTGLCEKLIDAIPESIITFPDHCMNLLGSPLHWAVRVRHLPLVRTLLELKANVNLRWEKMLEYERHLTDPTPSYSPLDLAAAFHYPEIAELLLQSGAVASGGSHKQTYTALHLIGHTVTPFSQEITHGRHRRGSVREVIGILNNWGCDINSLDSEGQTPLARSLKNPNLDGHVLEELLAAGAEVDGSITRQNENAAILIAQNAVQRRLNNYGLKMVLPRISGINESDITGHTALHYCASGRSGSMTEVLLSDSRVAVDIRTSLGETPLHLAATYGSLDVAHLLVDASASLESKTKSNQVPLEIAIMNRWTDVAHLLIACGASLLFTDGDDKLKRTAIHAAVSNENDSNGILKNLLENQTALRETTLLLDKLDDSGWAAIHQAAYYGDVDSVSALLKAGADRHILTCEERRSALDITKDLIDLGHNTGFGSDHERVKDGGPPSIVKFFACLDKIVALLKN